MIPPMKQEGSGMLELAKRVEAATGPDRRLDALIQIALDPDRETIVSHEPGRFPRKAVYGPVSSFLEWLESGDDDDVAGIAGAVGAENYTASLDAAMTMVPTDPEIGDSPMVWALDTNTFIGCEASIYLHDTDGPPQIQVEAATPALALTAAALRARASRDAGQ